MEKITVGPATDRSREPRRSLRSGPHKLNRPFREVGTEEKVGDGPVGKVGRGWPEGAAGSNLVQKWTR